MKILMFNDESGVLGGAEQYRRELAQILRERGHQVMTFCCIDRGEISWEEHVYVSRRTGEGDRASKLRTVYLNPPLAREFRAFLRQFQPDLVHLHNNHLFPLSILAAIPASTPVIQTAHDCCMLCPAGRAITDGDMTCQTSYGIRCFSEGCISWRNFLFRLPPRTAHRLLLQRRMARLLVPSSALQQAFSRVGIQADVVPLFVNAERFPATPIQIGEPRILFAGRLEQEKGVQVLLKALSILSRDIPGVMLDVVGAGTFKGELESLARSLGVIENVDFIGAVPPDDIAGYYSRAHVVVLPSIVFESCGLTLLEAMAAARPVVGSRVGGVPEVLADESAGFLVSPGDAEDLAKKISIVLSSRGLAEEMGRKGRERVERCFTKERHIAKIIAIYAHVTGKEQPEAAYCGT